MRSYEGLIDMLLEACHILRQGLLGLSISPGDGAEIEQLLGTIEVISAEVNERRVANANQRSEIDRRAREAQRIS